jgi:probable phosphoglycerate mutase
LETAEPIAARHGLTSATDPAFTEIEFGDWTGLGFNSLDEDPAWSMWNTQRSLTRPPRGETMLEVQTRAVARILALSRERGDGAVVLVSHQDVIKAVLAHLLGLSLDCLHRFEIDPGSVSAVVVGAWGAKILFVNRTDPGKTAAAA